MTAVNKSDIAEFKRLFAKSNVSVQVRPDWKGWIAVSLGILGVVSALTMYIFKTNAAADLEHQQLKTDQQLSTQTQTHKIQSHAKVLEKLSATQAVILEKLDELTRSQVKISELLRIRNRRAAPRDRDDLDRDDLP